MNHTTIIPTTSTAIDVAVRAADAVNHIQQMAVDRNQELNNKMIRHNAELKIQDLRNEGIGRNIDITA